MRDRSLALFAAGALAGILVTKMILLEPLTLTGYGLSITVVAALLPLALLLGLPGVLLITLACGAAHWLNGGSVEESLIAAVAVGVGTSSAYLVIRGNPGPLRWIVAGWVLTAGFVSVMARPERLFGGIRASGAHTCLHKRLSSSAACRGWFRHC